MNPKFIIYGLVDPSTKIVRYVGRCCNGIQRQYGHRLVKPTDRTRRANWIRNLRANGLDFEFVILDSLPSEENLNDLERSWIAYGRMSGWELTNHTDGGEGMSGYSPSPESRESRSRKQANRVFSEEHKAKIRAAKAGKPKSPEHRAKLAAANIGKRHSAESRAMMSEKHRALRAERGTTEAQREAGRRNIRKGIAVRWKNRRLRQLVLL